MAPLAVLVALRPMTAATAGGGGSWGNTAGEDAFINGISEAHANAAIDITAFNQSIVMGANLMGHSIDMTVVGGDLTNTIAGDDA